MRSKQAELLRHGISKLVDMAAPEHLAAAQAVQAVLHHLLGEPASKASQRGKAGATIHVGPYGSVSCADYTEAAEYLGFGSATLQVRLSQGGGRWVTSRPDPDTGEPMMLTVVRGNDTETHAMALSVLKALPAKGKKPRKVEAREPERNELGVVTTNRLNKRNPVENS